MTDSIIPPLPQNDDVMTKSIALPHLNIRMRILPPYLVVDGYTMRQAYHKFTTNGLDSSITAGLDTIIKDTKSKQTRSFKFAESQVALEFKFLIGINPLLQGRL